MFQFKLHKQIYFLTLLISLISFSGIANTFSVEKTTVEVIHTKTSNHDKVYKFSNGLIIKLDRVIQHYSISNFRCLLNFEQRLRSFKLL